MIEEIHLWGVKQNNLKSIDVRIKLGSFTVICGPSGSGKSSLAFDTLFAEGQRRYIESLSNYAQQYLMKAPKPDMEGVLNIPPSIAIEQKNSVRNSRSTVGTTTEVVDYLRLLFEKLAQAQCPQHKVPTRRFTPHSAAQEILACFPSQRGYLLVPIYKSNRHLDHKSLLAFLLQEGFVRIFIPEGDIVDNKLEGEIKDLNDPQLQKKGVPRQTFFLIVDRLAFTPDEEGRLIDSLQAAFQLAQKLIHFLLTPR